MRGGSSPEGCDSLTGLWTHRHFFEHLAYLRASCRRNNEPLSILIVDIDNFSEINATYGYAAGDEVLMEITRRLRKLDPRNRRSGEVRQRGVHRGAAGDEELGGRPGRQSHPLGDPQRADPGEAGRAADA